MDKGTNERAPGNDAGATREEVAADDVLDGTGELERGRRRATYLQDAALSAALAAENAYLGQVDLGPGGADCGEDILELVDDSDNFRS